jgi:hypothetical protein
MAAQAPAASKPEKANITRRCRTEKRRRKAEEDDDIETCSFGNRGFGVFAGLALFRV